MAVNQPQSDGETLLEPQSAEDQADMVDQKIGKRLKELRLQAGKTQADVAAHLSISAQQYQKYEKGATKCSIANIYRLADYYNREIIELLPHPKLAQIGFREDRAPFVDDHGREDGDAAAATAEILGVFLRIRSKATRRKILELLDEVF